MNNCKSSNSSSSGSSHSSSSSETFMAIVSSRKLRVLCQVINFKNVRTHSKVEGKSVTAEA